MIGIFVTIVALGWIVKAKTALVNAYHKIVVNEGHVALIYKDGKFVRRLESGKHRFFGFDYATTWVDMRRSIQTIPGQDVLTSDTLSVKVSLTISRKIVEPEKAMHEVEDHDAVMHSAAQLALRSVVAGLSSEDILANRLNIGAELMKLVGPEAEKVGVAILAIEVKDVMLPSEIRKAFTDVVTARKEGEASLERARAEGAALRSLANAARVMDNNPALLSLRWLKALESVGENYGNTLIMGMPEGIVPMAGKA
jgi:regulator of protease activity HflC (stomatin/prohibitin superfamily)